MRGASWGLPEALGRFQGPRDALGVRGASWKQGERAGGFLRPQGCSGVREVRGVTWE